MYTQAHTHKHIQTTAKQYNSPSSSRLSLPSSPPSPSLHLILLSLVHHISPDQWFSHSIQFQRFTPDHCSLSLLCSNILQPHSSFLSYLSLPFCSMNAVIASIRKPFVFSPHRTTYAYTRSIRAIYSQGSPRLWCSKISLTNRSHAQSCTGQVAQRGGMSDSATNDEASSVPTGAG